MKEVNLYDNGVDEKGIRLNGNESYIALDEKNLFKIITLMKNVELNRYPDTEGLKVRACYAKYAKVKAENIIMGNGSDEMLSLVIGSTIGKGKRILTLDPDFSMYDFYATLNDGEIIKYKVNEDGSFDIQDFIMFGIESNVDLIMFSNPNNPTGFALPNEAIIELLKAFKDTKVVIDEAYYEFNKESIVEYINEYKNLLVTRTLSKAWGLAAIRIGFLIGNEELIKKLRDYKVPYNVNSLSQVVAENMLGNTERVILDSNVIIEEREKLFSNLKELQKESSLEIKFYKSSANYIFGRTNYKDVLIKALNNKGIVIRNFSDDSFRITVGSEFENNKVVETIRKAFVYNGGKML
ncbi:histidinol-phosphate transaminase [Clostridium gasigenes]|uniref:Histidinol-phosphate aminotransferase n=1 Tax=Clostridium gasigenes TaxID=94869 RepID=A0A1H0S6T4_9CLOT|nr:histidinol-phosphate transaminase [Clostridium gasigenes]MBB6622754.1 histidinol-phosphate transaminase [Clostridium gasigenes]MBU3089488.1 histidinol-phosphate transaminase [Clostridium gasigenes]NKF06253.1 histidinol-phosphate transaminase [Clostridium gasigenes]QSW20141.1 histidinol-phosphate transaminase [Clostridium gasigenes]SDP37430.1 histidinol-phosphate aminotransferase [Clostridium gasigenes]